MTIWLLVGVLVLVELVVVARIRIVLLDGVVPLNPAGWFGYSEFRDLTVERRSFPVAYWFIVAAAALLALVFGYFIYLLGAAGGG
jgi:hypothetical protein